MDNSAMEQLVSKVIEDRGPFTLPTLPAIFKVKDGNRMWKCGVRDCPEILATLMPPEAGQALVMAMGYTERTSGKYAGVWCHTKRPWARMQGANEARAKLRQIKRGASSESEMIEKVIDEYELSEGVDPHKFLQGMEEEELVSRDPISGLLIDADDLPIRVQCPCKRCRRVSIINSIVEPGS